MIMMGLNMIEVDRNSINMLMILLLLEQSNDKMVMLKEVLMEHNQNDVDNIRLEMEEQQHEENLPLNQQNDAWVHAFVINVSNKIHVVGILFDIDSFHINDAIVFH
jgi:hypothetical protein